MLNVHDDGRSGLIDIGFTPSQTDRIIHALKSHSGMIAIGSTAGQGKSKTLQAIANVVAGNGGEIVSLNNDPLEYVTHNVKSFPVIHSGSTQREREFLEEVRHAMSVQGFVVANVFDVLTAGQIMEAMSAGFRALAMLNAGSALTIFERFLAMGVKRQELAAKGVGSCLVYQRLLPVTCPHCHIHSSVAAKDESVGATDVLNRLKSIGVDLDNIYFRKKSGCSHCDGTGYAKRMACAEVILPDDAMLKALAMNDLKELYHAWRRLKANDIDVDDSGYTVEEIALHRMKGGLFDPLDIESNFGFIGRCLDD